MQIVLVGLRPIQKKGISYYRSQGKINGSQAFYNTVDIERQLPSVIKGIVISQDVRQDLRKELARWFDDENNGDRELKQAEVKLAKLERMEKNLQRLVIEEEISFEDFKEHRTQIESERTRVKNTVDVVRQRQHLVKAEFEIALQLATELDFLFEKGTFDERRLLCETVFKRLYVKDGKVAKVELNSPFGLIASSVGGSESVSYGGP